MNDFIRSVGSVRLSQSEHFLVIRCGFDAQEWSQDQFEKLGIEFPLSLAGASRSRLAQYLGGRYAAKLAFASLGVPFGQVPIGPCRAPMWPRGVIGSITHTEDLAFCALAPVAAAVALGIDAEPVFTNAVSGEVCDAILSGVERDRIADCGEEPNVALTIVFSAKEAIFKALQPLAKCFFGFEAVELVTLDIKGRIASWQLRTNLGPWKVGTMLCTRFTLEKGLVFSTAVV